MRTPPAPGATPPPARINGRAAVVTLTYLGFGLQLVQVGLLPLLPAIGHDLGASPAATSWILTSGLLSGAVFLAVLTRLADLIGKRPVILLAMTLVLAGCLICGFSDNLWMILLGRVLTGAQLPMLALPEAIANDTMEPARAHTTISAIHVVTGLGIGGGLLLGTLIGAHPTAWHLYFHTGSAAALLGLLATALFVHDSPARAHGSLDIPGAVLLAACLLTLLLALSQGPAWGWTSPAVLTLLTTGTALSAAWWHTETHTTRTARTPPTETHTARTARTPPTETHTARTARTPLIETSYLTRPAIALPYAMTFLVAFGIYGALTCITRLAETPASPDSGYGYGYGYGWSSTTAAWLTLPQAIGACLGMTVLHLTRPRGLITACAAGTGLITLAFTGFILGHATPLLSMTALALDSMGIAVSLAGTQLLVLAAVPRAESGIATGLSVVMYALGNSIGSAVTSTLLTTMTTPTHTPTLNAYLTAFTINGLCAALALTLCIPLTHHHRHNNPTPTHTTHPTTQPTPTHTHPTHLTQPTPHTQPT